MSENASATAISIAAVSSAAADRKGGADTAAKGADRKVSGDTGAMVAQGTFADMDFELSPDLMDNYRKFMADYSKDRSLLPTKAKAMDSEVKKFMEEAHAFEMRLEAVNTSEVFPKETKDVTVEIAGVKHDIANVIKAIFIAIGDNKPDIARIILFFLAKVEAELREREAREKVLKATDKKENAEEKPRRNFLEFIIKIESFNFNAVYFAAERLNNHFSFFSPPNDLKPIYLILDLIIAGCPVDQNGLGGHHDTFLHFISCLCRADQALNSGIPSLIMFVFLANGAHYQKDNHNILTGSRKREVNNFSRNNNELSCTPVMNLLLSWPEPRVSCLPYSRLLSEMVSLMLRGGVYDYFCIPEPHPSGSRRPIKLYDIVRELYKKEEQENIANKILRVDPNTPSGLHINTFRLIKHDMVRACLVRFSALPYWTHRHFGWTLKTFYGPPENQRDDFATRLTAGKLQDREQFNEFRRTIIEPARKIMQRNYFEGVVYRDLPDGCKVFPFPIWALIRSYESTKFLPKFMQVGHDFITKVGIPADSSPSLASLEASISATDVIANSGKEVLDAIAGFLNEKVTGTVVVDATKEKSSNSHFARCQLWSDTRAHFFTFESGENQTTIIRMWMDENHTTPDPHSFLYCYKPAHTGEKATASESKETHEGFSLCIGDKASRIADQFPAISEEDGADKKDGSDLKQASEATTKAAVKPPSPPGTATDKKSNSDTTTNPFPKGTYLPFSQYIKLRATALHKTKTLETVFSGVNTNTNGEANAAAIATAAPTPVPELLSAQRKPLSN